nr:oligosaccharide flippase family protein [endosymbiont of unidentified scaly snail isolate Monju]
MWALTGKVTFVLATLVWNALITRLLTEPEVGAFYLIFSIVLVGELIVLGGMNQAAMRLIAARKATEDTLAPLIRGSVLLLGSFGLAFGVGYTLWIGPWLGEQVFHSPLIGELAGLTALWFGLRAVQTFVAFLLRGFHQVGLTAFFDGATTALLITLVLLLLYLQSVPVEVREVLLLVSGALVCTILLSFAILRRQGGGTPGTPGVRISEPLRIGLPLAALALTSVGASEAHVWIAGIFVAHADIAIYGVASRLGKLIQMPQLILAGVIPSSIAELSALKKKRQIQEVLQVAATLSVIPTLIGAIVIGLAARSILGFVFGESYADGWFVLLSLVGGHLFSSAMGFPGVLLAMTDHQNLLFKTGVISSVTGIAVSLALVQAMGIDGVALGAAGGRVFQNVLMWHYCRTRVGIDTRASIASLRKSVRFLGLRAED